MLCLCCIEYDTGVIVYETFDLGFDMDLFPG